MQVLLPLGNLLKDTLSPTSKALIDEDGRVKDVKLVVINELQLAFEKDPYGRTKQIGQVSLALAYDLNHYIRAVLAFNPETDALIPISKRAVIGRWMHNHFPSNSPVWMIFNRNS